MEKPVVATESVSHNARRKFLNMAISTMLLDAGFDHIETQCLETLCEMFQSLLYEIGHSSRSYCELASRTTPVLGDVVLALINMGISLRGLETFAKKMGTLTPVPTPQQTTIQKTNSLLITGKKMPLPSYIPNHFPSLPDAHAYIRTPTHKQPVTEYEAIRERASSQKRDVERALTRFLAKTSETHSLFPEGGDVNQMFPLVACKPQFPAYLAALNPTDQVFDFEELEYHYLVANRTEDDHEDENEDGGEGHDESKDDIKEEDADTTQDNASMLDNPFLKALGT